MTYSERKTEHGSIFRTLTARELETSDTLTLDIDEIGTSGLAYLVVRRGTDYITHVELDRDAFRQFKDSIVKGETPF